MTQFHWVFIVGLIKPGHQIASGQAKDSPYKQGSLKLQQPYFQALGLDLNEFYLGTLNLSIAPYTFELIEPEYTFRDLKWHPDYPAETFSFSRCIVEHKAQSFQSLVYYPHPETKIGHFQDPSIVEIIAPYLSGVEYGDRLSVKINSEEIRMNETDKSE